MRNHIRLLSLVTFLGLFFSLASVSASASPTLSAHSAYLYLPETDTVIFESSADERMPMASTTKIMTALVVLEACALSDIVTIDKDAVGIEGSSVYLEEGDRYTVEALLYAVLLQSANDAAAALAIHTAGDIPAFADKMNQKAAELGLQNTHFENPHGLDHPEHYTTAKELALLSAAALEHPTFRTMTSTYRQKIHTVEGEKERVVVNHNKMLMLYDDVIGVKTGFTKKSGRCLVSAVDKDGLLLIAVTLCAPNDWEDHKKLFDYGLSRYEKRILSQSGDYTKELPVLNGTLSSVKITQKDTLSAILSPTEESPVPHVELPHSLIAPIRAGEVLGKLYYEKNGIVLASSDLIAETDVPELQNKKGLFGIFRGKAS